MSQNPTEPTLTLFQAEIEEAKPSSSVEEALQFLDELENRHNQVLEQLDELNAKIEQVLESYLEKRAKREAA